MHPELKYRLLSWIATAGAVVCAGTLAWNVARDRELTRREATIAEHLETGEALFREGRFLDSARSFAAAADLDPTAAIAWTFLGNALLANSSPAEALIAYNRALEIDEGAASALLGRGMTHWLAGDLSSAETDYRRLIALDPDKLLYYTQLEKVLQEGKRYRELADMWIEAINRPRPGPLWNRDETIAYALFEAKDWNRLLEHARQAAYRAKTQEEESVYLVYRGIAYNRQGDWGNAIDDFERVVNRDPRGWRLERYLQLLEELVHATAAIGDVVKADHYRQVFERMRAGAS